MRKIYKTVRLFQVNDLRLADCYFEEEMVYIHAFQDSIHITDLTNALKHGKGCQSFVIRPVERDPSRSLLCDFFNTLSDFDFSLAGFIDYLKSGKSLFWLEDKFLVDCRELKATRVFSPFAEVKPIKTPSKWTVPHVWKALLSGQVSDVFCDGYYTDDYAYDAARNFEKGKIAPDYLAEKLITSPSGWWVSVKEENDTQIVLNVSCYQFDYNTVIFSKIA